MAYIWTAGETVTATKLNKATNGTVADGSASAPSINFTGGATTGFYLGTNSLGFSVNGASVGVWTASGLSVAGGLDNTFADSIAGVLFKGATKAARFYATSAGMQLEGVDTTGVGSFQPFFVGGSTLDLTISGSTIVAVRPSGIKVTNGLFRISSTVAATTTTLASLTDFTMNVVSGETYAIYLYARIDSSSTGGWKFQLGGGTATVSAISGTGSIAHGPVSAPVLQFATIAALAAGPNFAAPSAEGGYCEIRCSFVASSTGTFIPQFAQNSAAGTSQVFAGSYMWAQRV